MSDGACLQLPDHSIQDIHGFLAGDKPLPLPPGEIILEEAPPGTHVVVPLQEFGVMDGRSNVPLGTFVSSDLEDDFYYEEESIHSRWRPDVSTVAEMTEPSENGETASMRKPSFEMRRSIGQGSSRTSTSDYGQVIGEPTSKPFQLSDSMGF